MNRVRIGTQVSLFVFSMMIISVRAGERGIINNSDSPHSKLRSVDFADVQLTDGFWADKFEIVREVTIPAQWKFFNGDIGHHWVNFKTAAGLQEGEWSGRPWHDGDFYKWFESLAYIYHVTRDAELDKWMDEIIGIIAKAQQPDGYLSTHIILREELQRFTNLHYHELYNMGHLLTAACTHHKATGKDNFLDVAKKTGDYLYELFMSDDPELVPFGFNPSNIMGAVELYRTTGDQRYLDLANRFIENRGKTKVGETISREIAARHGSLPGGDQTQDRVPLREETEAVGHAVTATYLYAGASDAFMETGDPSLLAALDKIWTDVTTRKMYINGGVGPFHRGISIRRDRVHEAFADAYFLPNRSAYSETCANIGNAMWNWRMLNIRGDASYADIMELVLYNSGISGFGLDGHSYYYTNVLRRYDSAVPLLWSDKPERQSEMRGYCCPPQLARTIAKARGLFYSKSEQGLWVNLYGSNILDTKLTDGTAVRLIQRSDYPWDGTVDLTIDVASEKTFSLMLRIPGWVKKAVLSVNGAPFQTELTPGTYAEVRRTWANGDRLKLVLPMDVRLMTANPLVEENRNQVAIMRGPVVYCLESLDLPENITITEVMIPKNVQLTARFDPDLLKGVAVLEGTAIRLAQGEWAKPYNAAQLYREFEDTQMESIQLRMIPYYAWSNRGKSEMTVWMPIGRL